jgi:DNA topoisomerase-1
LLLHFRHFAAKGRIDGFWHGRCGLRIRTFGRARNVSLKKRRTYKHLYVLQPVQSAAAAGLRYISDAAPGIRRLPRPDAAHPGAAFRYVAPGGAGVRERAVLARIKALAIPPAWRDVWICPRDDCHIQATGRDAKGRKQYRYHARWRDVRDETKYGRVAAFARALPRIRRRTRHDLARAGLPREKVLATVVRLLETTFIRVGNEEYARENESFGLTTLRDRQVRVRGSKLKFKFRGKSGVEHEIELSDPRLAAIVRRMQDLPGEELFQYVDEQGETRAIESADVNAYLKEIAGDEFTSKDFRTWAGTLLAAEELRRIGPFDSEAQGKRNIVRAIEAVAARLGNTKAVCRKCYVHPTILECYLDGSLLETLRGGAAESSVVQLLERQMKRQLDLARRSGADGESLAPILARSLSRRSSRKRPAIRVPRARHLLHIRQQSLPQSLRSKP